MTKLLAIVTAAFVLCFGCAAVVISAASASCSDGSEEIFAGAFDGPGSLGGVMGTGITRAELQQARRGPSGGNSVVPHEYVATAYAPAAGGINCGGDCSTTASGIRVDKGQRRVYGIASNPAQNKYGSLAFVWPNPWGFKGPFVVFDTGGNFDGSDGAYRVDFYVWGSNGLKRANAWGRRNVRLSTEPIVSGGPTTPLDTGVADEGDSGGDACPVDGGDTSWGDGDGGNLVVGPGANRPGAELAPTYMRFARKVAALVGPKPLVITTGTNHNKMTLSGNVSDHWTGWAGDYGMSANGFSYGCVNCRGQKIAAAAMMAAGLDEQVALHRANTGGLFNLCSKGYRVQVIYRSMVGGNHYNHVHIGLRKGC